MRLTCPHLATLPHIHHGFFTRRGGHSMGLYESLNCGYGSGDDIDTVRANRSIVANVLGCNVDALCTSYQIHSTKVTTLNAPWHYKDAPEGDAMVTNTPGIALGILAADCLPILLADTNHQVIGAAHAGWKPAYGGVIEATIAAMQQLGATPATMIASVGPGISQTSYEVDSAFYQRFLDQSPDNSAYFLPAPRLEHYLFDLKGYAVNRLQKAGISHINVLADDTYLQEDMFFSFRRTTHRGEPVYGRQISAISLC